MGLGGVLGLLTERHAAVCCTTLPVDVASLPVPPAALNARMLSVEAAAQPPRLSASDYAKLSRRRQYMDSLAARWGLLLSAVSGDTSLLW